MWDVKSSQSFKFFRWYSGFTLTMWDVKMINSALVPFVNICFTLTMWDVKQVGKTYTYSVYAVLP